MRVDKLQEGSTKERTAWRAKVRAIEKRISNATNADDYNITATDVIEELLAFAVQREKRTRKKKGGI